MGKYNFLYLSEADICSLNIQWPEIFHCMELALSEHGNKTVENPPKPGVHRYSDSFMHAMPAYLKTMNAIGVKWVAGYPSNREKGIPVTTGLQIINDADTGLPLAVMDATWSTMMRTAAVTCISALRCASADARILGIIGAGVQGKTNAIALKEALPQISEVLLYDIFPEAALHAQEQLSSQLGIPVRTAQTPEEAARQSDILITATQKLTQPIVRLEWLKEGVLCLPLESSRAWYNDVLFGVDKFINDDLEQARLYQRQGAFTGGIPDYYAETGEIIAGLKPGRENPLERIMVMNIGLGCEDIAFGKYIYEKAVKMGKGTRLEL